MRERFFSCCFFSMIIWHEKPLTWYLFDHVLFELETLAYLINHLSANVGNMANKGNQIVPRKMNKVNCLINVIIVGKK